MLTLNLLISLIAAQQLNPEAGMEVGINSATSFCLIVPRNPGNPSDINYIAEKEREAVSGCTSSPPSVSYSKIMPNGFFTSAHYVSNDIYFQVTGTYDSSKYGLNPNDQGTQFDDSLASQGGVLPQSGCRGAQGYLEYFGANIFCIRCCRHAFSFYCDPSHDTRGCAKGIPGDYGPGFSNNGVGVNGSPGSTFGSAPTPPRPGIVSDWAQCSPHTDKCASSGWTCCQAPADAAAGNGKTTCRAPGYCAATPGPNPYAGGVGASSSAPAGVKDWNTCGDGDVCASSSFVCCVAKGDFTAGSSKKTCRPSSDCSSGSSGSINTGGKLIPNWNDCKAGVDSCNSGYTCCQAPADAAAGNGKTTCRASNAPGQSYGCSTSSSSSSGKLVSNWGNCRVGVDSCNSGYKCCIGPADKSTSKYTCRVSNAPGQSYGCSA